MKLSTAAVHSQAATLLILSPTMRQGQAYSNSLWMFDRLVPNQIAELDAPITRTSFDPFYDEKNLERFLAYLRYQLGEFDDEIREVQP